MKQQYLEKETKNTRFSPFLWYVYVGVTHIQFLSLKEEKKY